MFLIPTLKQRFLKKEKTPTDTFFVLPVYCCIASLMVFKNGKRNVLRAVK